MPQAAISGIYAITPECADTALLVRSVQTVLDQGIALVQYRNKSDDRPLRQTQALALAAACRHTGATLIINDDVALAAAVGAGVHLGRGDGDLAQARAALPEAVIGASCYADLTLATHAQATGASYVAFGALYPSMTKPKAPLTSSDQFDQARRAGVDLPLVGIGGITLERVAECRQAGADALAVVGSLFGDILRDRDFGALRNRARALVAAF